MRDEQGPLQWQGFRLAGLLCLGLAIVELTLERQRPWWRGLLPLRTMVGHNALYISVGFVWLHFVDDGEPGVNEETPDGYQFGGALFFSTCQQSTGGLESRLPGNGSDLANGSSSCCSLVLPSSARFCTGPRPSFRFSFPLKKLIPWRFRFSPIICGFRADFADHKL
jgi:hypothetical protein